MSETLIVCLANVLELIRDQDVNQPFLDDVELRHLIVSRAQEVGAELGLGHDWQTGAFTLSVGSLADYDITNPTNSEFKEILKLRIAETGHQIRKASWDEIERMRGGLIAGAGPGGDPTRFALRMDDTNNTTVRINTIPSLARTIDILRSIFPANTYTDATVIPFAFPMLRGIEKAIAAELIDRMSETDLAQRKLTPRTGQRYQADFERAMVLEQQRLHKLKATPRVIGAWR